MNLFGLDRNGLQDVLAACRAAPFHAGQVYRWIYARGKTDISAWTDLSLSLREQLRAECTVDPGTIISRAVAGDGTVKYTVSLPAEGTVEAVFMPGDAHDTVCISSQIGCALGCEFCLTGRMGPGRNLATGEIVGQAHLMRLDRDLGGSPFNIVFMGMGEPLLNYEAVIDAVRMLADSDGFGLSRKRLTISTAGLVPGIMRLAGEKVRPRLAVSLNATDDRTRDLLMPVNRRYPLGRLLDACDDFGRRTGERVTLEYVLLRDVNDRESDIGGLEMILRRTGAKLNLIPFNPVAGHLDFLPPSRKTVLRFRDRLLAKKLPVSIRWSRGQDARAACGQLALLTGD